MGGTFSLDELTDVEGDRIIIEGINKIVEVVNGALTFTGETRGAVDRTDLAQWKITKTAVNGINTIDDILGLNTFDQIFDNRVALFPYQNNFSLLFDGFDNHCTLPTVSAIDFIHSSTFTWSFWLNTSAVVSMNLCQKGTGSGNSDNMIRFYIPISQRPTLQIRATSVTDKIQVRTQNLSGIINNGLWHNLIVTYDGSSLASGILIYFDGVLTALNTETDNLTGSLTTGDDWVIATQSNISGNFFKGNMDEVSVWDKVLSLSEIQEIYNSGKPDELADHSAEANLISNWPFNKDTEFPTPKDQKASNDLTMVNMEAGDFSTDVA